MLAGSDLRANAPGIVCAIKTSILLLITNHWSNQLVERNSECRHSEDSDSASWAAQAHRCWANCLSTVEIKQRTSNQISSLGIFYKNSNCQIHSIEVPSTAGTLKTNSSFEFLIHPSWLSVTMTSSVFHGEKQPRCHISRNSLQWMQIQTKLLLQLSDQIVRSISTTSLNAWLCEKLTTSYKY